MQQMKASLPVYGFAETPKPSFALPDAGGVGKTRCRKRVSL